MPFVFTSLQSFSATQILYLLHICIIQYHTVQPRHSQNRHYIQFRAYVSNNHSFISSSYPFVKYNPLSIEGGKSVCYNCMALYFNYYKAIDFPTCLTGIDLGFKLLGLNQPLCLLFPSDMNSSQNEATELKPD